ncbi:MAG TPA: MBL fold metallo-hydrolase [Afifellaceae bacterium]|nr:MBL fold metallo-hydrolase [Afifellaceae bacterium]
MTAALQGEIFATISRFRLGGFEVTAILDGAILRDSVKPPFCLDLGEDDIAALGAANHISADRFEHPFVPTLVNTGKELILFDVGFGAKGPTENTGLLRARMAEAGYAPEDVDVVVFTHVHPDHILGVTIDDAPAFPNARYAISQVEFDEWNSGVRLPENRMQNREMFLELVVPLAENMTFLAPGGAVAPGVTAMEAYGHSRGHMMFMVEDGGSQVLLWGDLANHYVFSLQVPEARVFFDDDPDTAIATRKRVLDMVATDGIPVIGHHMPFPSLGFVERSGGSYRWAPASYQMRI